MCILFNCSACTPEKVVNTTPVKEFDLTRYLGTWYEIARFDHSFEKGMEYTRATYSIREDGMVNVENSGYRDGKFKISTGKAKRPDPINEPALMRVSFFGPFYSDYRVLLLGPDYSYALVSSKGPNYLWILSRAPKLPDETLQVILSEAHERGFDTSDLVWVKQRD